MTSRQNIWANKERIRLIRLFGNQCWFCDSTSLLEFAHIRPTGLHGKGRGKSKRISDVRKHPYDYALTCKIHNALAESELRV